MIVAPDASRDKLRELSALQKAPNQRMEGFEMAEREGFEPSVEVSPHTRLAGERLQPTRPSLQVSLKYYALIVIRTIVIQQF